jgi:cell wall-associated NlpC family hydrolase
MLDEQYNQARARAESLDAEVAAIGPKLAESDRQLAVARTRLAEAAVGAYVRGGSSPLIGALMHTRSEDWAVRTTYVHAALDGQRGAVTGYAAARRRLLAVRDRLRATQRAARATATALDANRRAAEATVASQQSAVSKAQGELAPLVAQASAARAQRTEQQGKQRIDNLAAPPTTAAPKPRPGGGGAPPAKPAAGPGSSPTTTARSASPPSTSAPKPPAPAPTGPPPPVKSGASAAVNTAKAQLGKPYVYGAAGPDSFDCSGLTMYAWRAGGVGLPHSAEMQYNAIPHVAITQLQPGDLIFYGSPIHHVGIYVGGGQMIEAPYTGSVVRYASISRPDMVGAGRP